MEDKILDGIIKYTDMFKKTFMEGFLKEITIEMMIFILLLTLLLSFFIFLVYRFTVKDIPYSKGYVLAMCMVSVVTCAIVLAVQSNIVISLGMVGALSIVRFRTAVKNPIDLLFMFWSISIGIITGAGLYLLAIVSCVIIAMGITLYQLMPLKKAPQVLVIKFDDDKVEKVLIKYIKEKTRRFQIMSRSLFNDDIELVIELSNVKDSSDFAYGLKKIESVKAITMLKHDGETIAQ